MYISNRNSVNYLTCLYAALRKTDLVCMPTTDWIFQIETQDWRLEAADCNYHPLIMTLSYVYNKNECTMKLLGHTFVYLTFIANLNHKVWLTRLSWHDSGVHRIDCAQKENVLLANLARSVTRCYTLAYACVLKMCMQWFRIKLLVSDSRVRSFSFFPSPLGSSVSITLGASRRRLLMFL